MFNFGGCTTQKLRKPGTSKKSKGGLDWSGVIALDKVELGEGHDIVGESRRTVAVLGLMQAKVEICWRLSCIKLRLRKL
ncbi:hypothetical protein CDL15_Pgr007585 [Punica granatum]|uniref:Uncharacterized protein n=1 Tax=Punica granatum TaxID=22663 RepID=A0A218X9A8_PUNGR|nr:hypothetical protein CDL15_Pgr007585 [Punica granatum]